MEIYSERFQKIRKLLNFRKANRLTKNSELPGGKSDGTEISGKKFTKISV